MTSYGKQFRSLWKESPLLLPGAFNALVGLSAKKIGFRALYFSGGAFSASMGIPDVGIFTLSQLAATVETIVKATGLPILVDADTGFGDVSKTVTTLEKIGAAGIHLEDQIVDKRCGHLEGKQLISIDAMAQKIKAAVKARRDKDFVLMARTDARGAEGLKATIERGKAYIQAGADALFPEGLQTKEEFQEVAKAFPKIPKLANMTEFGKTPYFSAKEFSECGYPMVIFPVTTLRLAMKAIEKGLKEIQSKGSQKDLINIMQTRTELYDLLGYEPNRKKG